MSPDAARRCDVLHVVPESIRDPRHRFLGSTKDVRGRTEYFRDRGLRVLEVAAPGRSDAALLRELRRLDLERFSAAFFELPLYPASLRFVRRRAPRVRLLTRSINAEFLHQLDHARGRAPLGRRALHLVTALRRLRLDRACSRLSDSLLCITDWERDHYWNRIAPERKVRCLPYFLPTEYLPAPAPEQPRRPDCVCLMSSTSGVAPLAADASRNFFRLVEGLGAAAPEWRFLITGDLPLSGPAPPARVIRTGLVENPYDLLSPARAVALLTDLGHGFKTKILDAAVNGCRVLVTDRLYRRLPAEIRPCCLVVDLRSVDSFREALRRSLEPLPGPHPNEQLRARAFGVLDELLPGRG